MEKLTFKDLEDKYLQEDVSSTNVGQWDGISELYSSSAQEKLLNTPELVKLYISKWGLYSSSAEKKLLNTPELVELYINKWKLYSSSAEKKYLTLPN